MNQLRKDLREYAPVLYDPSDDPGNPYQHMLDADTDDVEEDKRLGLSVYGMRPIK